MAVSSPSQRNSSSDGDYRQQHHSPQTSSKTPTSALASLANKLRKPSVSALHALKLGNEQTDWSFDRSSETAVTPGSMDRRQQAVSSIAAISTSRDIRQASSSSSRSASRRLPFRDLSQPGTGHERTPTSASNNDQTASHATYADTASSLSHNTSMSSRKSQGHLRARSNSSSSKRADPPAPLDFSPPRPSWIASGEDHPAISRYQQESLHQQASSSAARSCQQPRFKPTEIEQSDSLGSIYSDYSSADVHHSPTVHLSLASGRTRHATSSAAHKDASNYSAFGLGLPFPAGPTKAAPTSPGIPSEYSRFVQYHALPPGAVAHSSHSPQISSTGTGAAKDPPGQDGRQIASHNSAYSFRLPRDASSSAHSLASLAGAAIGVDRSMDPIYSPDRSMDPIYSPERSPVTDRRGLVGLGELATPKWTAVGDDRGWGPHQLPARDFSHGQQLYRDSLAAASSGDVGAQPLPSGDWQGELLGSYDAEEPGSYSARHRSLPVADSWRSFSDAFLSGGSAEPTPLTAMPAMASLHPKHQSSPQRTDDQLAHSVSSHSTTTYGHAHGHPSPLQETADSLPPESASASSSSSVSMQQGDSAQSSCGANDSDFGPSLNAQGRTAFYTPLEQHRPSSASSTLASLPAEATSAESFLPAGRSVLSASRGSRSTNSAIPGPMGTSRTASRESSRSLAHSQSKDVTAPTSAARKPNIRSHVAAQALSPRSKPLSNADADTPSFMRGTVASASRRNSTAMTREGGMPTVSAQSQFRRADSRQPSEASSRTNSPYHTALSFESKRTLPSTATGAGHSRQSSLSTSVRRAIPPATAIAVPRVRTQSQEGKVLSHTTPSPHAVSDAIVRSTRSSGLEGVDIAQYAAGNENTAEALRKLDGISSGPSPRASRAISAGSARSSTATHTHISEVTPRKQGAAASGSTGMSRQNSKSSRTVSPTNRPSSASSRKSQTRVTHAELVAPISPLYDHGSEGEQLKPPSRKTSFSLATPVPALPSLSAHAQATPYSPTSGAMPTSPYGKYTTNVDGNRRPGQRTPPSTADFPPTPSLSSHRSSSASIAIGTSYAGSRDSTSATSISAYGSSAARAVSKSRRGSASSDVSSVHSTHQDNEKRSERTHSIDGDAADPGSDDKAIPPVPPLPKDWEQYRPSYVGDPTNTSSARDVRCKNRDSFLSPTALSDRHLSLEKPAGPRTFRNASGGSSMSVPSGSLSMPATPMLGSTAAPAAADLSFASTSSKTPMKAKWSLSYALGLNRGSPMPKSSSASSLASFVSNNDTIDLSGIVTPLATPDHSGRSTHRSNKSLDRIRLDSLSKRKLSSVPNLQLLASKSSSHVPSQGIPQSVSSSVLSTRIRTDSLSSDSTAATAAPPAVAAVSPVRSRSTLQSPRKTPSSGIPFFTRKPSIAAMSTLTLAPSRTMVEQFSTPVAEEKPERKSILGLNLFKREGSKKNLSAIAQMPVSTSVESPSTTSSFVSPALEDPSEFGVRPSEESKRSSVSAKASGFIARRRGKTISATMDSPAKPNYVHLPPIHMTTLPASTVSRLETLSIDEGSRTPSKRALPAQPRSNRLNKVTEATFTKSALPSIAGSPSIVSNAAPAMTMPPGYQKPGTPTRIPRLASGSRSARADPQAFTAHEETFVTAPPTSDPLSQRRGSLAPGGGLSSSAPQQPGLISLGMTARTPSSDSNMDASVVTTTGSSSDNLQLSETELVASSSKWLVHSSSSISLRAPATAPGAVQTPSFRTEKRHTLTEKSDRATKIARTPVRNAADAQGTASHRLPKSSSAATVTSAIRSRLKSSDASFNPTTLSHKHASLQDALPTSKSSRLLSAKLSIPVRLSKSVTSPSLSHSHSPVPSEFGSRSTSSSRYGTPIGEDEIKGDEEMCDFVERQKAKKEANGTLSREIEQMFDFPDAVTPAVPLAPDAALHRYGDGLCDYEKEEVCEYKHVYFAGDRSRKHMATRAASAQNFGYDDERGDYLIIEGDHIAFRYEIIDTLGKGSFGQVLRCRDHQTGDMIAIKIIRNKKRFHNQAMVEIKVLENLKRWDPEEKNNLLKMGDHFTFRGHLCITTELLSINLYELIKANSFNGFSTTLIRRFTVQILLALTVLRHHRVVHCDLKPENLLLKHPHKSGVKVIDFGSSCFEHEKVYTYIQSRFYRSPEVILGMNYHMAIDMWSLGCIMAELYTGYPIFPGENEAAQLACIMEVLGVPDKHIVDKSSRRKLFFDSTGTPRPVVDSKGRRRRPGAKSLASALKCDDDVFVDFIAKCLSWDPDRRMKPGPALRHPFCMRGRMPPTSVSAFSPNSISSSVRQAPQQLSGISTPRRLEKRAYELSHATPASSQHVTLPATAPVHRIRTNSAAVPSSVGGMHTTYRLHA